MFGFMIVYPAGFLLGVLLGLSIPFGSGRRLAALGAIAGTLAALFATWEPLAFLAPNFGLGELLLRMTLPAAAVCFVLGVIGTHAGAAARFLIRWLVRLVVETIRLG